MSNAAQQYIQVVGVCCQNDPCGERADKVTRIKHGLHSERNGKGQREWPDQPCEQYRPILSGEIPDSDEGEPSTLREVGKKIVPSLFAVFDPRRLPEASSRPSPVLVDKLDYPPLNCSP